MFVRFKQDKLRNIYRNIFILFILISCVLFYPLSGLCKAEEATIPNRLTMNNIVKTTTLNTPDEYHITVDTFKHRMIVKRNGQIYRTFPIAIGTEDTPTPIGDWKIISKQRDWGSGFGTRWLGLNVPWGVYGIHGTNKPHSIGRKASHGCVRMFNRDVEKLYQIIPVGTKVTIKGYLLGGPWELPRRLVEGERGPDVMLIQQRLKYTGFYQGRCDGIYRGDLEFALKKFQLANHMPPDRNVSLPDYQSLGLEE